MDKTLTRPEALPRPAITGVASGLCLMALFTVIWSGICFGGLIVTACWFLPLIFPLFSIWFIVNAVRLFKIAKFFPRATSEADIAEEKRTGRWFGIIFGAEGLLIFIGINIVVHLGYPDLTIPTIALVVGLHFFPLAKVFKRTVDYYLASWSTLIALCGFAFTLYHVMPANYVTAFVGAGLALATTCYGVFMVKNGREFIKKMPVA